MKTNKNMVRRMGVFEVYQRTKDGFFSATKLAKQWNKANNDRKEVNAFLVLKSTKEYIHTIEEDIQEISYVKSKAPKGVNAGTWMHPYLFIDFAMWLNPTFKLQVIKFVHDQLIEFRHDASDNYRELCSAVQRFENINYTQLARGLNYIVFKKHEKELRQSASEKELDNLNDVQKKLAFACDMGYINSFDQLIEEMRRIYNIANI